MKTTTDQAISPTTLEDTEKSKQSGNDSMFQEALKSTRTAYQLIPFVSLILMVFSVSVIPTGELYTQASRQIKTALGIDWSAYRQWAERALEPYQEQKRQTIQETDPVEVYGGRQSDTQPIEAAWQLLNTHFPLFRPEVTQRDALETVVIEMDQSIRTYIDTAAPEEGLGEFDVTIPLDIYRYFHSPEAQRDAVLIGPDAEKAKAAIWNSVGEKIIHQTRYEGPTLLASEVSIAANVLVEAVPITRVGGGSDESYRTVVHIKGFRADWLDPATAPDWEAVQTRYVDAASQSIPQTSIATWLATAYPEMGISPQEEGFVPFGGLEHVWREIADRPLIDADLYLNALAAEERRRGDKVTLMGVTVPAGLVPFAGPLALLYLQFNLLQLLLHVTRHAPRHREVLAEFPWPVLHGQRIWWLHPATCLVGLPIATQWVIALRMTDADPLWVNIGWVLTACSVACSLVACRRLVGLRSVVPVDE
ncbi:hypothetical protein FV139_13740 [Parahaliea maris]|uniref:Uncharacterized protein n=1 Tax=Parahaliea maris TaxID=2716870 RepID=A0A5C9A087_9GAMM|nr:hypothetical protein [Parahaliea maris]TXS93007.1 hypothetical protein FV139_13740 [Parahaliea maris]